MSQDDPYTLLILTGITVYVFYVWLGDLRKVRQGVADPKAFPGATLCPTRGIWVAMAGALALLGLETGGEYVLGTSTEQSDIKVVFLLAMISAAFGEELVCRGFLVVTNRGSGMFLSSVVVFSTFFTLMHPFLWQWHLGALTLDFSLKAWWSTAMIFVFSLWLYAMRFPPKVFKLNPQNSLIPCIAAHLAKNLGVFVIKLAQGHVSGWF